MTSPRANKMARATFILIVHSSEAQEDVFEAPTRSPGCASALIPQQLRLSANSVTEWCRKKEKISSNSEEAPRRARETVGAVFGRRSEVRSQPFLGGSWALPGGGSSPTMPRMGGEVVVEAGVAPFAGESAGTQPFFLASRRGEKVKTPTLSSVQALCEMGRRFRVAHRLDPASPATATSPAPHRRRASTDTAASAPDQHSHGAPLHRDCLPWGPPPGRCESVGAVLCV